MDKDKDKDNEKEEEDNRGRRLSTCSQLRPTQPISAIPSVV
jgi:hypothetical protein